MSCETDTATLLRASGQKVTPQRLIILSCLRHAGGHVTAGQILEEARRSYPYMDASTVYRTLAAARELHLVSETNLGGGDNLFEWLGADRHHHLICRSCGQVSDLDEAHLDVLAKALERDTGFLADLQHIAIFGLCRACRARAADRQQRS
ncbi:MAG TPA: transcriptional repressor [Dehalococcoidia bacterium]|nr:transcriptional repressor [Dehalococcoidia bacterium]